MYLLERSLLKVKMEQDKQNVVIFSIALTLEKQMSSDFFTMYPENNISNKADLSLLGTQYKTKYVDGS